MAKISTKLMLALCICLAISMPTTLAQFLPPPFPGFQFPPIPGLPGPECFKIFGEIPGCLEEIFKAFLSGQVSGIGPACCKAITDVSDKCLPKMFPTNPFFPPLLTGHCSAAAPTPA